MNTLRGTSIIESGCRDPVLNIFYATLEDGRTVVFRQPRKKDAGKQRTAWKKISEHNRRRYKRVNVDQKLYSVNQRCQYPLYRGEFPGILPLTIEVNDEVVGFSDIFFKLGVDFERFQVEPDDKCANGSIIALDKFHGLGIGSYYSIMSNLIARHYDCKWILGRTFLKKGMRGIRAKDGWVIVSTDGNLVDHKKLL